MSIQTIPNSPPPCTGANSPRPNNRKPLQVLKGGNQSEKPVKPHCKVSTDDINWVRQQPPCVQQLYLDCIAAEQFGGAFHKLETNLTYKSFQKASAALTAAGLFEFEELFGRLPSGRPGLIGYRVRNLHGYYNRAYWEASSDVEAISSNEKGVQAEEKTNQPEVQQNQPEVEQIHSDLELFQKNGQKSEELQGFQNPNNVANNFLTTYQQPTKVVGTVVGSSTPNKIQGSNRTALAPLGGASPPDDVSVDEGREDALSELLKGNESEMVESRSASEELRDNNQLPVEDQCSAAAPPENLEKWSSEAIAHRMQLRPGRQDKLKRAGLFGDYPGFSYLQECWGDPSLRIVIKKLLAKFPQWEVACVGEELVDWNKE